MDQRLPRNSRFARWLERRSSVGEFYRIRFSGDHHRNDRQGSGRNVMAAPRFLAGSRAGSHRALDTRRKERTPRPGMGLSGRSRHAQMVFQRHVEPAGATRSRLPVGALSLVERPFQTLLGLHGEAVGLGLGLRSDAWRSTETSHENRRYSNPHSGRACSNPYPKRLTSNEHDAGMLRPSRDYLSRGTF